MFHSRTFRSIVILIVALVFASTAYALAGSNTLPDGNAGDGSNTISGYVVSSVSYNLQASDPGYIKSVDLVFTVAPGTVEASIDGTFGTCSGPGTTWNCTFADSTVDVLSAASLRVIAVE
jgi:hypothetical protein